MSHNHNHYNKNPLELVTTDLFDLITVNGRISKKLVEKVIIPEIDRYHESLREITKLKKALEVANKTIGFYGDPESWINRSESSWTKSSPRNHADSELIRNYHHPKTDWVGTIDVGGKRAREAQKQIQEIMEEK